MAFLFLLSRWSAENNGPRIHAVTVDHGLRPESASEARQVEKWVKNWPCVTHHILTWRGGKPKTKIIETARAKRYALLHTFCRKNKINYLFLAHQQDDQAETMLIRLSAGSGPEGLSGILPVQKYKDIILLRPLLDMPHERLCATLRAENQAWVEDPTNKNTAYARPRLRAARDVLEHEGLTSARLAQLARRMARARDVVDRVAEDCWGRLTVRPGSVSMSISMWQDLQDELKIRILARALVTIAPAHKPARLEQVEEMAAQMEAPTVVKPYRATLAGCLVTKGAKIIKIGKEKPRAVKVRG